MMTLKCRSCSAIYPVGDAVCPSCLKTNSGLSGLAKSSIKFFAVFFAATALFFWIFDFGKSNDKDASVGEPKIIASAFSAVRSKLKDPESAVFGHLTRYSTGSAQNVVCGTVNSKNGFGGYAGVKKFLFHYEKSSVVFDDGGGDFSTSWNLLCR
ncbi:hypothetical protein HX866_11460 [Pseudomonas gingeri]|uniref:hypothetical protein n=1 Tax=Pseudomonas gingeri TaxID=117681 RepID=UPI0015A0D0F2|nr:hypothetical protein [Pseudomonas gingeri]NWA25513.1 hypothetical protein [Pseudomonas gingeri]